MVNLGAKIKTLRLERNMSQVDLAQRIGVSNSTLSAYELDSRAPSYEQLVRLAVLFGVSTDYLLGLEKTRTLCAEGLTEKEINLFGQMIEAFKER
jgi:transcriptional regulator with XRE-family HTH domain